MKGSIQQAKKKKKTLSFDDKMISSICQRTAHEEKFL